MSVQATAQQVCCRDCKRTSSPTWYWTNAAGVKMRQPRCRECHETEIRRALREFVAKLPEGQEDED